MPWSAIQRGAGTVFLLVLLSSAFARADDGPLTKALKRVPADRQGPVIDMIGKRGTAADLDYLFEQALKPEGFSRPSRLKALEALAESAQTRDLRPSGDLARLTALFDSKSEPAARLSAVRLAGLWKSRPLVKPLQKLAEPPDADEDLRASALESIASIGGPEALDAVMGLAAPARPAPVRLLALAALARLDVDGAAGRAGAFLRDPGGVRDLSPLISAFLNRQGGADKLAVAIEQAKPPADSARLALRAVFALGRSDPALVGALTKAAGLDAEVKPLDKPAMDKMIGDVGSLGNASRGEQIFRRSDLNCMKCHALSGAGGGVGPDLSALGSSSPVDYIVNSIMLPDQAIKEEFHTLVVQTADGQVFQGIVADKDDKRIVLKEAAGTLRTVATSEIEASKEGGSLMPKGLVNFLTRAEFIDLVRFLSELGKPGPYAIRSTPTVQRWRYLKPVSKPLAESVPNPDTFESEVLAADGSRWLPAYAQLAGDLPLGELTADTGTKVLYVQAEVDVSHGDNVEIKLNDASGVTAWIDAIPASFSAGASFPAELATGRHKLTFRVDTTARKSPTLRVEVLKPAGSSAEYSVVGGR